MNERFIDLVMDWYSAQVDDCCSCHNNPPCSFCVEGYNLPLVEYIELRKGQGVEPQPQHDPVADYDRAMGIIK